MDYRVERADELLVSGRTEHACIDDEGRVRRIPRERREMLKSVLATAAGESPPRPS